MTIVGRASGGKEAVAMAIIHRPDVVLIDANLPSRDGVETTYSMKQNSPGTVMYPDLLRPFRVSGLSRLENRLKCHRPAAEFSANPL